MTPPRRVRIIGPGRAGGSLRDALRATPGHEVSTLGRGDSLRRAAHDVDVVVIATPDTEIASVAALIEPDDACVVMHMAGSLGLEVLQPHIRRAAMHPLVSLPSPEIGSERLRGGWYAVAGDAVASEIAEALDGTTFGVADENRAIYHATAAVAANHLVALLGQVERLAAAAGVPFEAFVDLARGALDAVAEVGPRAALTGPAARGDEETIAAHLDAIEPQERAAYRSLLAEARRLLE